MSRTISFVNATTYRTSPTGVSGVHQDHGNANQLCLVLDLLAQVVEAPRRMLSPLSLANRYPVSYARKVLKGNSAPGVFGFLNNFLGDYVVDVVSHALFFASALLEQTTRCLGSLTLQLCTKAGVAMAQTIEVVARVILAITGRGNVDNAQINAEESGRLNLRRFLNVAGGQQVPLALNKCQISLTLAGLQEDALPLATDEGDMLATGHRPDRDCRLADIPAQDAVVISDSAIGPEGAWGLAIQLVGVGNTSDAAHDDLCREVGELTSGIVVSQFVKAVLAEGAGIPGALRQVVTSGVGAFHRALEGIGLFFSRQQFYLGNQLHSFSIAQTKGLSSIEKGR